MNKEKSLAGSNVLEDMSYFTKSSNAPKDSYDLNVSNFPNYIPYNVENQIISGDNSYNFNSSINASNGLGNIYYDVDNQNVPDDIIKVYSSNIQADISNAINDSNELGGIPYGVIVSSNANADIPYEFNDLNALGDIPISVDNQIVPGNIPLDAISSKVQPDIPYEFNGPNTLGDIPYSVDNPNVPGGIYGVNSLITYPSSNALGDISKPSVDISKPYVDAHSYAPNSQGNVANPDLHTLLKNADVNMSYSENSSPVQNHSEPSRPPSSHSSGNHTLSQFPSSSPSQGERIANYGQFMNNIVNNQEKLARDLTELKEIAKLQGTNIDKITNTVEKLADAVDKQNTNISKQSENISILVSNISNFINKMNNNS